MDHATEVHRKTIRIYDLKARQEVLSYPGHSGIIPSMAYSPDGRTLASAGADSVVRLWDTGVNQEMLTLKSRDGAFWQMDIGPSGATIAALSQSTFLGGTIQAWDTADGREFAAIRAIKPSGIGTLALSPDGRTVATGADDELIRLWDLKTQAQQRALTGHSGWVEHLAFSPDGKILASTQTYVDLSIIGRPRPPDSVVTQTQEVHFWDPATGQLLGRLPVPRLPGRENRSIFITFSRGGRFLIAENSQGVVRFWDMRTRGIERTLFLDGVAATGLALSPDGTRLVTIGARNSVTIRDADSGREIRALRGHEGSVLTLAFSPDGKTLASAGADGTVRLWNPDFEQERLALRGHTGGINAVAFSSDGALLASGGSDGTIRLWQGHPPAVTH
jgi:WD40 repeat protein